MNIGYKDKILERINSFDMDYVFIANDFYDIAEYETIRKNLNRLVNDKQINRILKGIYYKPKYIEIIDEYKAPNPDEVAKAIARKYNWTIAPSGNTALNLLGLDTQVPVKWTYISDGRYAKYSFDNVMIEFKRRNNSEISKMSQMTAMVIGAIKNIGKGNVNKEQIMHLQKILSKQDKEALIEEGKFSSAWIYDVIKSIGEEK